MHTVHMGPDRGFKFQGLGIRFGVIIAITIPGLVGRTRLHGVKKSRDGVAGHESSLACTGIKAEVGHDGVVVIGVQRRG